MVLGAVLIFIALLLVLVLVHEFGHFIVAKWAGCAVEEFGFGFPPRLFGKRWRGTLFSLNLIPLGGFVKITGEDMTEENPGPAYFGSKSAGWRIAILAAGVTMNVILAVVLLSVQGIIGAPVLITDDRATALVDQQVYVLDVSPASPAAEAGVKAFDRVLKIGSVEKPSIEDIQRIVREAEGQPLSLEVSRQAEHLSLTLTPRTNPPANEGPLGVSLSATGLEKIPWWRAPWHGLTRTWQMLGAIVQQFSMILIRLITEGVGGGDLTGPIGIAIYTNEAAQLGLSYVLEFGAIISLNLALINILPLPALDGGRILFVVLEKIRGGRRLPVRFESLTHTIGFALLIFLMLVITFRDIKRFF